MFPIAFTLNRLGQHYDIDPTDPTKWSTLVRGHWFWDFAFLNSNYHLEHHYFAGVPFYRLPALQRALVAVLRAPRHAVAVVCGARLRLAGREPRAAHELGDHRTDGHAAGGRAFAGAVAVIVDVTDADVLLATTFLERYPETSLLLLSTLRAFGSRLGESLYSGNVKAIVEGGEIAAVWCLTRSGNLVAQAAGRTDFAEAIVSSCGEEPIAMRGVLGEWSGLGGDLGARPRGPRAHVHVRVEGSVLSARSAGAGAGRAGRGAGAHVDRRRSRRSGTG